MHELPATPFHIGDETPCWWVKVVGMLQHNWALPLPGKDILRVLFVDDAGGMFDRLDFGSEAEMAAALERNGFEEFAQNPRLQDFMHPPQFPLHKREHPNGPIYSSGLYWRS